MKLSEILKLGVVNFDNAKSLEGRVFIKGKPTTYMQARVVKPYNNQDWWTQFQFGIDIYPESGIVLTTCERKWDNTVLGLLKEMAKAGRLDAGYDVIVCDDSFEDSKNTPLIDTKFLNGIEEIEFDV